MVYTINIHHCLGNAMKKHTKKEVISTPSDADLIKSAKDGYFRDNTRDIGATDLPSPYYTFSIGDQVVYGRNVNVRIVEIFDDGKAVIVKSDSWSGYRFMHWYDVYPANSIKQTNFAANRFDITYTTLQLDDVVGQCIKYGINDTISCQRGYVWSLEDKQRLIDSIFRGSDIGKFVFVKREYPHAKYVIDGKQRINAIMGYMLGEYSYRGVYYRELGYMDRMAFDRHGIQFGEIKDDDLTDQDLAKIFLTLNSAGVPQTEEHLKHVQGIIEGKI